MKLKELLKEVTALGFEDESELNDSFIFAANRALRNLYNELCQITEKTFFTEKIEIDSYIKEYSHTSTEVYEITAHGTALSFKYFGEGRMNISIGEVTKNYEFQGSGALRELLPKGNVTISFEGESDYKIKDFVVYKNFFDSDVERIPLYNEKRRFSLPSMIKDFISVSKEPEDKSGKKINGAEVISDYLFLPSDFSGTVNVYYKRLAKRLTVDDLDCEIDIAEKYNHLLALLTASYIWLDEDSEKAEYYMMLYRDEVAYIRRTQAQNISNNYSEITGWA